MELCCSSGSAVLRGQARRHSIMQPKDIRMAEREALRQAPHAVCRSNITVRSIGIAPTTAVPTNGARLGGTTSIPRTPTGVHVPPQHADLKLTTQLMMWRGGSHSRCDSPWTRKLKSPPPCLPVMFLDAVLLHAPQRRVAPVKNHGQFHLRNLRVILIAAIQMVLKATGASSPRQRENVKETIGAIAPVPAGQPQHQLQRARTPLRGLSMGQAKRTVDGSRQTIQVAESSMTRVNLLIARRRAGHARRISTTHGQGHGIITCPVPLTLPVARVTARVERFRAAVVAMSKVFGTTG